MFVVEWIQMEFVVVLFDAMLVIVLVDVMLVSVNEINKLVMKLDTMSR